MCHICTRIDAHLLILKCSQIFSPILRLLPEHFIQRGCPLRAVLPLEGFQGPKRWMCSTKLLTMIYYVKTQIFEKRIFFRTAPPPGLGRPGLKRLKRPIYLLLMNGFSKFLFSMKTIMNYEFFLTEILFFVQK